MKVFSIALNTFRENLRDKLLYNLLIFALLMIGSSLLLMRLTLGNFFAHMETSQLYNEVETVIWYCTYRIPVEWTPSS
ncbi:MAG: hypothetical protein HP477_05005 [Nitrospira sp.]|nr:hypothetical protein [Nitrospira sp.]